jgi:hypothetical protein
LALWLFIIDINRELPDRHPATFTLHSFSTRISFLFVARMLSTTRSAASMALRGATPQLQKLNPLRN